MTRFKRLKKRLFPKRRRKFGSIPASLVLSIARAPGPRRLSQAQGQSEFPPRPRLAVDPITKVRTRPHVGPRAEVLQAFRPHLRLRSHRRKFASIRCRGRILPTRPHLTASTGSGRIVRPRCSGYGVDESYPAWMSRLNVSGSHLTRIGVAIRATITMYQAADVDVPVELAIAAAIKGPGPATKARPKL